MVEKDNVIKEKLRYEGLGNFKETYKYARHWFDSEGYNLVEDKYEEKLTAVGKEIEIDWTATKKLTDYYKSNFSVKWRIRGLVDVEVEMEGGRKVKMNKFGDLGIEVKGIMEKDYTSKWEGSAFQKFLSDTYHKYIVRERTEQKEEQIREDVRTFLEEMKALFELTGRSGK